MKRDPALVSLSHDHHHALVAAGGLAKATEATRVAALADLHAYWANEGRTHFQAEEGILFPAYAMHCDPYDPLLARALCDHLSVRQRIHAIEGHAGSEPVQLRELGALIREHVRFEERTLFPLIEEALSRAELEAVATALAVATAAGL